MYFYFSMEILVFLGTALIFPLRGFPFFCEHFSLLFQGFKGFGRDKNEKKTGKEGQGVFWKTSPAT